MRNNPTKPSTLLEIDGWQATAKGIEPKKGAKLELDLVFELESIADAEDATGLALITGLGKKEVNAPRISLVRIMLWASARPLQPEFTMDDAKKLVTQHTWSGIWNRVLAAWIEGMKKPGAEDGDDPPTAQS
jgi:hypothetical protein